MPDEKTTYERIAGRAPTAHGFSRTGGSRAVEKRIYGDKGAGTGAPNFAIELHELIEEILGTTRIDPGGLGKKLNRRMPKASPLCPWMYAERISEMVGLGQMAKSTVSQPLGVPAWDEAAFYETYEFTIEYQQRPYALAEDAETDDTQTVTWTKPDGSSTTPNYANEWLRYVDVERIPAGEYITAQVGQYVWDVPGNAKLDGNAAGSGQARLFLLKEAVKITWFEVPYEYVHASSFTNAAGTSYISQGLGHVNQFDWFGFDAGTLLFIGVNINRYTPPAPAQRYQSGTTIFDNRKLCDIQFLFTYANPERSEAPSAAANANVIQAGHNLLPWAHTGGHYFCKTIDVDGFAFASDRPLFPSFPYELLFTNPGV